MVAYQKAVEGEAQQTARVGTSRLVPGSFGDLLRRYYTAPEFLNLAPATQRNYRRILERFAEKCRDLHVAALKRSHIKTMIGQMEDRQQDANRLSTRQKKLLTFAYDLHMQQQTTL